MRKSISVGVAVGGMLAGSLAVLATSPAAEAAGSTATTTTAAARLDNPFQRGEGYVNPEWKAKAESVEGGARVSNTPTAVWIDRIAAIEGDGVPETMGLRDHLDAALAQGANYVQFVLYDLPQRDCLALASDGELSVNDLARYKSEFIDAIAAIESESKYRSLRIINLIEPNSLTNLIYTAGVVSCAQVMQSGVYSDGIAYALDTLHAAGPNVFNYLDAADHGELGWDTNLGKTVELFDQTVKKTRGGYGTVDGFVTNVANYAATVEPYLGDINRQFNGVAFRSATWLDWNSFYDEQSFAQAYRARLISVGFPSSIGMVIDTGRNGWGGPGRPARPSTSTDLNTFVDESRIDRRIHAGNYCNQAGAGLGARPTAAPAPGIDAYAWVKPPGESDGSSLWAWDGYDRMCDPSYTGNARNNNNPTGALPNSPAYGIWFPAQFTELMANAYPPLDAGATTTTTTTTTTSPTRTYATTTTTTTVSTTRTATTTTRPTTTTTSTVPDSHLANPFRGGKGYVNPEWKAKAESVEGGSRVSNTPTAVWLERISEIDGPADASNPSMSLRDHLDEALAQGADYLQVVLYDLPQRNCYAWAPSGELTLDDLPRYKSEFVDAIAAIEAEPKYRGLRIVNIVEPYSLSDLIIGAHVRSCDEVTATSVYVDGVAYALRTLSAAGPHVYNYLDAAQHGLLGWDTNLGPSIDLFNVVIDKAGGYGTVDGFITNTANYAATVEPYLGDITRQFSGLPLRAAGWIDWNQFYDEQSFAQAYRAQAISLGFPSSIGMLIDTSRNGWGGPKRPTGPSTSTDLNTFVDESRVDRRLHAGNYCNQAGAGLGERPTADPAAGIDAYVWAKPPGLSDGASSASSEDDPSFDRMCDPTFTGNERNGNHTTGALADAPGYGTWFPAQFTELMANANPPLDAGPSTATTTPAPATTTSTTTKPTTTTTTELPLDNPFQGGTGYVNPEWKANAESVQGGARVSNTPTAVWIDRIAAIEGISGRMGVRDHLDAALAQGADYVQFVLYDLPMRNCAALASDGELSVNDLARYKSEFIDAIAAIESDSKYRGLRIINLIEPDSVPNFIYGDSVSACRTVMQKGIYTDGIAYALDTLHMAGPNVYNYLDAAHHALVGWDSNFGPTVDLFTSIVQQTRGGYGTVNGFVTNVANYAATVEPYLGDINRQFNGVMFRSAAWIDWNQYYDELSYAQAFRTKAVGAGFPASIGMLIDTGRNGWGGPDRPTGPSSSTDLNTFVDDSRIDRRIHAGNYCNQVGAGLGAPPAVAPAAGIDAYVWAKPPGESDGQYWEGWDGFGYDRMCDPTYHGNSYNHNNLTGALGNAPNRGEWFPAHFAQLLANAYPPLDAGTTTTTTTTTTKPTTTTTTTTTTKPTTTTTKPTTTTTTTTTTKPTTTTQGGRTCKAVYKVVAQWPGGFQGEVTVTAGTTPIAGWKLTWTYANGQTVQQYWSATVTSSGASVTASNVSWNGSLQPNGSTSFGFLGSWLTTNGIPAVTCVAS